MSIFFNKTLDENSRSFSSNSWALFNGQDGMVGDLGAHTGHLVVGGLDGGSYQVFVHYTDFGRRVASAPGLAQAEVFEFDRPGASGLEVVLSNLGDAAEPKLGVFLIPRRRSMA